jgi:ketosteroid isomerase-like protein
MSALQAAQQLLDGFAAGDLATALGALDPELELTYSDAVPWKGTHHGHAGFQTFAGMMLERFEVEVVSYELFQAGEDRAASRVVTKFTLRATGESVTMPVMESYWARNGKLHRIEPFYFNQTLIAEMYAKGGTVA